MSEKEQSTYEIGEALSKKPAYFDNVVLDNLLAINLELGAELWVVKDRLRVLEELLAEKGVVTSDMIEHHQPLRERLPELRAQRNAFIEKIFGAIKDTPR